MMKRYVLAVSWMLPNMMEHLWLQVGCCEIQLTLISPEAGKYGVRSAWCLLYSISLSGRTKLGQGTELIKTPSTFQLILKGTHSKLQNQ